MPEPDATDRSPRVSEAGAAATTRISLPAGFICPKCDYDLGGASVQVCSECGRGIERGDLVAFRKRVEAATQLRALIRKRLWFAVVAVFVMSAGAAMLALEAMAALMAATLCSIAVVGSFYLGWAAAALAPDRDRAAIRVAWITALPWLHGPWLILPLFCSVGAMVVFLCADLTNEYTAHRTIMSVFGFPGEIVWSFPAVASLLVGASKLATSLRPYAVKRRAWWPVLVVAWLVVAGGAMTLGAVGVMFAGQAVSELIGKASRR